MAWTDPSTGLIWAKENNNIDVDWVHATDYCRNLQLAGHSGWRLPTIDELRVILHTVAGDSSVRDKLKVTNNNMTNYLWSSSQGNASGQAWVMNFGYGQLYSMSIRNRDYSRARCVRRPGTALPIANTPGAVASDQGKTEQPRPQNAPGEAAAAWIDPATGLMWAKKDNGSNVNWQEASNYCRNLGLSGYSGWRLATMDELAGIYDPSVKVGTWHVKGNLQLSGWEWSTQRSASGEVWYFNFPNGEGRHLPTGQQLGERALCVRRTGE